MWWMTSKAIGHIFCITRSFVYHLKSIGEFKPELQSGNAEFGSNLAIFSCDLEICWMTLENKGEWAMGEKKPWSNSPESLNLGQNVRFFPGRPLNFTDDFENNRASRLYYVRLCSSFHSHGWIQTEVTVWQCSIGVNINDFLSRVALKINVT